MPIAPVASRQNDPCILLVDDNRNGLIARKAVLEELGYRVQTCSNGEEALRVFLDGSFDLVVTDYKMPRMCGIELIRKIRDYRPETPIILVSGFVEPLGLNETITRADTVIPKSAQEVQHLVRAVGRLLNRRAKGVPRKPAASQSGERIPRTRAR